MKLDSNLALVVGVLAGLGLPGCGSSTMAVDSSGGAQGKGGVSASGGLVANGGSVSAGGAASNGGSVGSGGVATTGGANGLGGSVSSGGVVASGGETGTGGSTSSGGSSAAGGMPSADGTMSLGGSTSAGGAAAMGGSSGAGGVAATGGSTSAGGTTGTSTFVPLCAGLVTAAGVAPTKAGLCTAADPQLCYKTCGPESKGFKSETCVAGAYAEQAGCSFPAADYSCYKIPTAPDATCPATAPQASTPCTVAACVVCGVTTGYLDSTGAAKVGYCVCPVSATGTAKWSCASTTAWPCPAGTGC
jgi:hypothetical protein